MYNSKYIYIISFICLLANISPSYAKKTEKKLIANDKPILSEAEQRKFDYYFYEAANAKVLGDYNTTFDYLEHCYNIDSTNSAVLYDLGSFYNSLDQKSKALRYFENAVKYDKDNFYYNVSLAGLYLELQQYPSAISVYESLIAKEPDKTDLFLYLSEAYRLEGNLPKAIDALDKLEKTTGLNERISMQKFQLYSVLENKTKAYAEFEKYIEKYPREIKYYVLLGNIYINDNKLQEAYMVLSKARSIDPDNPYLITAMASYYEKANRKEDAERELNIALLSPKLDIDTKLNILGQYIGTLQQNEGDTKRANVLLDTLIIEHPQEPKLNLMYGELLMLQKRQEEAQFQFRVFAESNPSNPIGWEQLLRSIPNDSINQSIEVCQTAISYLPDYIMFYFYLGIGEYQNKEYEKALNTLKEGVDKSTEKDPPRLLSEFYGMIGNIYYENKNSDSAFIAFEKALKYVPDNIGVLNNYSYYLSLEKKNLDKAEKMSRITITAEPTNPTYLDTYGWVLFEQGDYVSSKIYLESAVKYSKEKEKEVSAEVLEHYGDVLFKSGDEEKALEYWIKAKETEKSESKTLEQKIKTKTYISE